MRILLGVHYYLPAHQAGTELYTRSLARQFKKEGHSVWIFTSEDQAGPGFKMLRDQFEGVPVFRIYYSRVPDFSSGYQRPEFDRLFAEVLDEIKPEIVHFQHLFRLSTGMVGEAKKRNIPVLLTLADYWLLCPAIIMLKPEDAVCQGPEEGRACAGCPHAFGLFGTDQAGSWFQRSLESWLGYAHRLKRELPPWLVDFLKTALGRKDDLARKLELINHRRQEMKKVVDQLSLLISPSRFLMEMMLRNQAAPREKIIFSDYGFETGGFSKKEQTGKEPNRPLTFGFIGTLVRHKGLKVLLQARRLMPAENIALKIFGELRDFPGFVREMKKLAGKDQRIQWMGGIEHDQVSRAHAQIDVLVVPSIWYENSPLTIHEAFLSGTPVLASDLGGMRELLSEGGGILFAPGSSLDLAARMKEIIANPGRLEELRKTIPPVKNIEDNCRELLLLYQMLFKNSRGDF